MYGVVLWSDPRAGSAVIWCEDEGELAYYEAQVPQINTSGLSAFNPGDYVQFDMSEKDGAFRVTNPQAIDVPSPLPMGSLDIRAAQNSGAAPLHLVSNRVA